MVQLPESSSSIEGKVKWLRASSIGMWKNTCEASHNETAAPIKNRSGGFMWAQKRKNLPYDKFFASIDLTYDKQKDIMILR